VSSFLVSDKLINQIITFMGKTHTEKLQHHFYRFRKTTITQSGSSLEILNEETYPEYNNRVGAALHALNLAAVNYRYEETTQPSYDGFKEETATDGQVLMSLRCFLYQCSEGDISEKILYKDLEVLRYEITSMIVEMSPEYQNAQWGV
jgi:hypothetical protein